MIWLGHSLSKWRIYACVYNSVPQKSSLFRNNLVVQSNSVIRNFLVTLKLFLIAKCSLSLWSKLTIGHGKWFLNKQFLITRFDWRWKSYSFFFLIFSLLHFFHIINRKIPPTIFFFLPNKFLKSTFIRNSYCIRNSRVKIQYFMNFDLLTT